MLGDPHGSRCGADLCVPETLHTSRDLQILVEQPCGCRRPCHGLGPAPLPPGDATAGARGPARARGQASIIGAADQVLGSSGAGTRPSVEVGDAYRAGTSVHRLPS